jgi:hypothetical protein
MLNLYKLIDSKASTLSHNSKQRHSRNLNMKLKIEKYSK